MQSITAQARCIFLGVLSACKKCLLCQVVNRSKYAVRHQRFYRFAISRACKLVVEHNATVRAVAAVEWVVDRVHVYGGRLNIFRVPLSQWVPTTMQSDSIYICPLRTDNPLSSLLVYICHQITQRLSLHMSIAELKYRDKQQSQRAINAAATSINFSRIMETLNL